MEQSPNYQGIDPVLNAVSELTEKEPETLDLFNQLKADIDWGVSEKDIKLNKQENAAERLVSTGLARWETKENPSNNLTFRILVLSQN